MSAEQGGFGGFLQNFFRYLFDSQLIIKQVQGTLKCLAPGIPLLIPFTPSKVTHLGWQFFNNFFSLRAAFTTATNWRLYWR